MEGSPTTIYAGEALFAYVILRQSLVDESSAIRPIDRVIDRHLRYRDGCSFF